MSSREAGLEPERIDRLADDIALLRSAGREVLIVSSGAIGAGGGRQPLLLHVHLDGVAERSEHQRRQMTLPLRPLIAVPAGVVDA